MTNPQNECPKPQVLQKFLLGQLSVVEIEECQEHLSVCDPCVETVQDLKAEDTFTDLARQALGKSTGSETHAANDEAIVERVIQDVENWKRSPHENSSHAERPSENADNNIFMDRAIEVHRLLRDAEHADDLGQLAHFRVCELIGSGSTGVVYRATDTRLDRSVVLKILRPSLGDAARSRFIAEAKATAAIEHENVITIYEVGNDGTLSFIAMQWIPGQTLEQKMAADETLTLEETQRIIGQIAAGLSAAHEHGLIHRDIKPANIWMPENDGGAKILDFGLVRVNDEDPQLTCTGMIAGTPCYMSPEQSRGDQLDARSDLFSLGCLMYQALTGRLPFRSENALATLRSIQRDQPTSPSELDPGIPTDTSDLAMCLLEKSPSRRPPNARAVIDALSSQQSDWGFEVAKPTAAMKSSTRRKTIAKFWKSIAALIFGISLGVLGVSYGQQIVRIATNHGEIVIDSKVDDVEIEVLQNGKVVRVVDLATEAAIEIKAGSYQIRPVGEKNSIEIDKQQLVLKRGASEVVRIKQNVNLEASDSSNIASQSSDPNSALNNLLGGNVANMDNATKRLLGMPVSAEPYRLQRGDVLGIFIEGVLGEHDKDPPIHIPDPATGLPPAIGFPIHVEHNGRIAIPMVDSIEVAGKTIDEIRQEIHKAFKDGDSPILRDEARILVSIFKNQPVETESLLSQMVKSPSQDELEIRHQQQDEFLAQLLEFTTRIEQDTKKGDREARKKFVETFIDLLFRQTTAIEGMIAEEPKGKRAEKLKKQLDQAAEKLVQAQQLSKELNEKSGASANVKPSGEEYDRLNEISREVDFLKLKAMRKPEDQKALEALAVSVNTQLDMLDQLIAKTTDQQHLFSLKAQYKELVSTAAANKSQIFRLQNDPIANEHESLDKLEADAVRQQERFAANEIDRFELLQSKVKLLQGRLNSFGSGAGKIESAKKLLEISNEQLELVENDEKLASPEQANRRNELMVQRAGAAKMLTLWERESGVPVSMPVYDGKTYQELLSVVRSERDLTKLNKAVLGLANLADQYEQQEMLAAIFYVARRGFGVADGDQVEEFNGTIQKIITQLDVETAVGVFVSELKSGSSHSAGHFFRSKRVSKTSTMRYYPFAKFIEKQFGGMPNRAEALTSKMIEALQEYSNSDSKLAQVFRFLVEAFGSHWDSLSLRENDAVIALGQEYFDTFVTKSGDTWGHRNLAKLLPRTKGLKDFFEVSIAMICKKAQEEFQESKPLNNRVSHAQRFMDSLRYLPEGDRPKELLVDLANIFINAQRIDAVIDVLSLVDEEASNEIRKLQRIKGRNDSTTILLKLENEKVIVEGVKR